MELKGLLKGRLKELATGFFTLVLSAVTLLKVEAVIGGKYTLLSIATGLLLVVAVVVSQVVVYGKASEYLRYRKDKLDDRPLLVGIINAAIIGGVPMVLHWWQSEPQPSLSLGGWQLLTLPDIPPSFPPDWFVPSLSAALVTLVSFNFLREAGDKLQHQPVRACPHQHNRHRSNWGRIQRALKVRR